MEIGVILGDVHGSLSPRDHLDALLRQVEAAQRAGMTYLTIGHHYVYGDYRWLQPIPTLARLAAELDDGSGRPSCRPRSSTRSPSPKTWRRSISSVAAISSSDSAPVTGSPSLSLSESISPIALPCWKSRSS